jgi:sugar phosphate permease
MSVEPSTLGRDARVIGVVGTAHLTSHFFHMALPALFPILKEAFGVPYIALGLLVSLFYAASGIGQTAAGFLVDRLGAPRVLLAGLALLGGAAVLAGFAPSYAALLPLAVLAGLGNSVFHPCDYSILTASVSRGRLGRGYGVHGISGNLGWALAPVFMVGIASALGWRAALVAAGCLGFVVALFVASQRGAFVDHRTAGGARIAPAGLARDARLLLTAPLLAAFAYFALAATSQIGLQTFMTPALIALYRTPLGTATAALTAFLVGSSAGIFTGGFLADRTARHDLMAGGGMLGSAVVMLAVASGALPGAGLGPLGLLAGFCMGVTSPARDLLVRAVTPTGASGKVFGFVYSGLDLGSSTTPLLFGWILDRGTPGLLFVAAAGLMLATIATVVPLRRAPEPAVARP